MGETIEGLTAEQESSYRSIARDGTAVGAMFRDMFTEIDRLREHIMSPEQITAKFNRLSLEAAEEERDEAITARKEAEFRLRPPTLGGLGPPLPDVSGHKAALLLGEVTQARKDATRYREVLVAVLEHEKADAWSWLSDIIRERCPDIAKEAAQK